MSVLQRKELEDSPLADLHAIASELGIEGFRTMRRDDLVKAILDAGPGDGGDSASDDDGESNSDSDDGGEDRPRRRRARRSSRGRGGRSRARGTEDGQDSDRSADDEDDEESDEASEPVAGVLDILSGGSGFVRVAGLAQSDADAYVSPAQIRRCELRAGDEVGGPVRAARRGEKHPSLVRVEKVNGSDAEPPEQRPAFDELTAVHPTRKLKMPTALKAVPVGLGSRVAISGGPGSGATALLADVAKTVAKDAKDATLSVVLIGARPEEVTDWSRAGDLTVAGGSFDDSLEAQAQAAELAVERGKRAVERGKDAIVLIDSIEPLQQGVARRVFGAARACEEGGSLTVIAVSGLSPEAQRQASTHISLEPASKDAPKVAGISRTLRADLIG